MALIQKAFAVGGVVTFDDPVSSGSTIIVAGFMVDSASITSVTDDHAQSYTLAQSHTGLSKKSFIYYKVTSASGVLEVDVNTSPSNFANVWAYEISAAPFADADEATGTSSTPTGPVLTGTGFAAAISTNNLSEGSVSGIASPWTFDSSAFNQGTGYLDTGDGTDQATFSQGGSSDWVVLAALFTASGGGTVSADPTELDFINRVYGFSPHLGHESDTVTLTATGDWTATSDVDWLLMDGLPTLSGTGDHDMLVSIGLSLSNALLQSGIYTAHITVTPDGGGDAATISVKMKVG